MWYNFLFQVPFHRAYKSRNLYIHKDISSHIFFFLSNAATTINVGRYYNRFDKWSVGDKKNVKHINLSHRSLFFIIFLLQHFCRVFICALKRVLIFYVPHIEAYLYYVLWIYVCVYLLHNVFENNIVICV